MFVDYRYRILQNFKVCSPLGWAFFFLVSLKQADPQRIDMTTASDSSFDAPRIVMWATLLIGLGAAGYELSKGAVELALLIGVGGLVAWAALRVLLQIRSATAEK
jgi:hypothetical protein